MAKQRVYGFDEDGYRRVRQAVSRVMGSPTTGAQRRRQPPTHSEVVILLGKTDEAITGKSATTGTVSIYTGTPSSNSDTGTNVEAESWVDIDSGIYVNLIRRGGGWECYPLECNA